MSGKYSLHSLLLNEWAHQWPYWNACLLAPGCQMIRSPCTSVLSMSLFTLPSGLMSSVKFISDTLLSSRPSIKMLNISESSINPRQTPKYVLADRKTVWVTPASGNGKPIPGIAFPQGLGCTWWVMQDGEVQCVPRGDLILGESSQWIKLYYVNCYITLPLYVIITVIVICCINGITVRIT